MSREHVASLNISSDNHSVSNGTSLDVQQVTRGEKEPEKSPEINKFVKPESTNSESDIDEGIFYFKTKFWIIGNHQNFTFFSRTYFVHNYLIEIQFKF